MVTILNLAAGKLQYPLEHELDSDIFVVNLDTMYYKASAPEDVESAHRHWENHFHPFNQEQNRRHFRKVNSDAFEFMERTSITFDKIVCYRFLEHIKFTDVLYFIYLMSTCLKGSGEVDIIVPDYENLAKRILAEDPASKEFEAENIITTTELLNEPGCPHASIWTMKRFEHFFGMEKRFETIDIEPNFEFDGRDIYLRYKGRRVS